MPVHRGSARASPVYLPLLWKRWRVCIVALKGAAFHATASHQAARTTCRRHALRGWRRRAAERRSHAQSVAHWEQRSLGAALERLHHQAALARIPGELHAASPVRINIEGRATQKSSRTPLSIGFSLSIMASREAGGNATILEPYTC